MRGRTLQRSVSRERGTGSDTSAICEQGERCGVGHFSGQLLACLSAMISQVTEGRSARNAGLLWTLNFSVHHRWPATAGHAARSAPRGPSRCHSYRCPPRLPAPFQQHTVNIGTAKVVGYGGILASKAHNYNCAHNCSYLSHIVDASAPLYMVADY